MRRAVFAKTPFKKLLPTKTTRKKSNSNMKSKKYLDTKSNCNKNKKNSFNSSYRNENLSFVKLTTLSCSPNNRNVIMGTSTCLILKKSEKLQGQKISSFWRFSVKFSNKNTLLSIRTAIIWSPIFFSKNRHFFNAKWPNKWNETIQWGTIQVA